MEEEKGIIRYCNIVIIPVKGEGGNKGDDTDDEGIEGELGLIIFTLYFLNITIKTNHQIKTTSKKIL